jgi:hypothetical protein
LSWYNSSVKANNYRDYVPNCSQHVNAKEDARRIITYIKNFWLADCGDGGGAATGFANRRPKTLPTDPRLAAQDFPAMNPVSRGIEKPKPTARPPTLPILRIS